MSGFIVAQLNITSIWESPIRWELGLCGIVTLCALGLGIVLASGSVRWRRLGYLLGATGLVLLATAMPKLSALNTFQQWTEQIVFWLLAAIAIVSSVAAVTARNPVYTAIWFAGSLLGVAGLFLFQSAQFLGLATIVVYAGAIVVTFLFVLMLANPEGSAKYDRISWAKFPMPIMVVAAAALVAFTTISFINQPPQANAAGNLVLGEGDHMASFGGELFAKHMVSVEVAGTILLIALVGAVAIVIQGKESRPSTHHNAVSTGGNSRD